MMAIENLTSVEETFFTLKEIETGTRVFAGPDPYSKLQVVIEVDPILTVIERQVYNIFMLLGDVGGFSGLLVTLGSIVTQFFNYLKVENHLAAKLYHVIEDDSGGGPPGS